MAQEPDPESVRLIKQSVLADVNCVLARASGIDIEPRQALAAVGRICEILFSHPEAHHPEIPRMFWETPLGRACDTCCRASENEQKIKTTLRIPHSVRERLRLEAEVAQKSLSDLITEKLSK